MKLGAQQAEAQEQIEAWFEGPDQVYYLGGWAGTGKTTSASMIASKLVGEENVIYAAYTGKAAYVMQTKGCDGASTMHSWIYVSKDASKQKLLELQESLEQVRHELSHEGDSPDAIEVHPRVTQLKAEIFQEEKEALRPRFSLNRNSSVQAYDLGVLDEVSMVNEEMARDWLSFGRKTLVIGDPAQLPPVGGEGAFTRGEPNYLLTEIHRQARDNPIIHLSTIVREGGVPKPGRYGKTRVVHQHDLSKTELRDLVLESDQLIVGRNKTRHLFNQRVRTLRGIKSKYPTAGETIVCLRNNIEKGLFNGATYIVKEVVEVFDGIDRIDLIIYPVGEPDRLTEVHAHTHHFTGREEELNKRWYEKREAEEFAFGYALTCHKMQGSQCSNPVIWDESGVFRADKFKWLYTAVTRATDYLTLIL